MVSITHILLLINQELMLEVVLIVFVHFTTNNTQKLTSYLQIVLKIVLKSVVIEEIILKK